MPEIVIFNTLDELVTAAAKRFIVIANESIELRHQFNVSLSGGSSPKKLYKLLASTGFNEQIDWNKVYFFFGDERYVPATDDNNNGKMVDDILFKPLAIPDKNIFRIDTSLEVEQAAENYARRIAAHFGLAQPSFDLVLLGLGDNSHTASLFPYTAILNEAESTILPVYLEEENKYRISMTAAMINYSRHILFLVYGEDKADAVYNVLEEDRDIHRFPAQLIRSEPFVEWYLDRNAASHLKRRTLIESS